MVKGKGIAYLFFFAMKKEERGNGYGSDVMELLKKKYRNRRILLALEQQDQTAINSEQRKKRHDFYERCGFQDMKYQIKEASVIYDVMGIGGEVSPNEYRNMINDYLGVMKLLVNMKFIKVS